MSNVSRRRFIYAALFLIHFFFVAVISCRDITWLVANQLTFLSSNSAAFAKKLEPVASGVVAQNVESSNPIRRVLFSYFRVAGIDRGYGYFAPNIPGSYQLVFELHYPDRETEYVLPSVSSKAAGLRVSSLLDEIGHAELDQYREYLIRSIARGIWREHRDAMSIRAIFGISRLPSIAEFENGKRKTYEFLYAYDFTRENSAPSTVSR